MCSSSNIALLTHTHTHTHTLLKHEIKYNIQSNSLSTTKVIIPAQKLYLYTFNMTWNRKTDYWLHTTQAAAYTFLPAIYTQIFESTTRSGNSSSRWVSNRYEFIYIQMHTAHYSEVWSNEIPIQTHFMHAVSADDVRIRHVLLWIICLSSAERMSDECQRRIYD